MQGLVDASQDVGAGPEASTTVGDAGVSVDSGAVAPSDGGFPSVDPGTIPGWDMTHWSCPSKTGVDTCLKEWLGDPTDGDGAAGFINTGFIALVNGQIALQWYNPKTGPTFAQSYASASKTMVGVLLGIAQQEGFINIEDTVSSYLNPTGSTPWSSTPTQEGAVTLKHLMTHTSGFDTVPSTAAQGPYNSAGAPHNCGNDDGEPNCLQAYGPPGTQFRYNTGLYGLLRQVLGIATSNHRCTPASTVPQRAACFEEYFTQKLGNVIGLQGAWENTASDPTELHYVGTALDGAAFGYLLANQAQWNGVPVVNGAYFTAMTTTNPFAVESKYANTSYGYLTWLAGKPDGLTPGSDPWSNPPSLQWIPGPSFAPAPSDAIMAIGSGGEYIHVTHHGSSGTPRASLVLVRLGTTPSASYTGQNEVITALWQKMNMILCDNPPTATTSCP
jgi:CubicO group peptidase (beta-lactamase class C family)